MNTTEVISKINNINLQSQEDLQKIESILSIQDNALIELLFKLLERFPFFNLGNPDNIVRYLKGFANNIILLFYLIQFTESQQSIMSGC